MFCNNNNNNSKNCLEKSLGEVKLEPGWYEYAWGPKYPVSACVQPVPKVHDMAKEEQSSGLADTATGVYNFVLHSVFPLLPRTHR